MHDIYIWCECMKYRQDIGILKYRYVCIGMCVLCMYLYKSMY